MDLIILRQLQNNHAISGYDVMKLLYNKFHILPSPGTVYSILYSLERKNLVEGKMNHEKRVYTLTELGKKHMESICAAKFKIQAFLHVIFSDF